MKWIIKCFVFNVSRLQDVKHVPGHKEYMGADTAQLQDELTGALIGLARATEGNENLVNEATDKLYLGRFRV